MNNLYSDLIVEAVKQVELENSLTSNSSELQPPPYFEKSAVPVHVIVDSVDKLLSTKRTEDENRYSILFSDGAVFTSSLSTEKDLVTAFSDGSGYHPIEAGSHGWPAHKIMISNYHAWNKSYKHLSTLDKHLTGNTGPSGTYHFWALMIAVANSVAIDKTSRGGSDKGVYDGSFSGGINENEEEESTDLLISYENVKASAFGTFIDNTTTRKVVKSIISKVVVSASHKKGELASVYQHISSVVAASFAANEVDVEPIAKVLGRSIGVDINSVSGVTSRITSLVIARLNKESLDPTARNIAGAVNYVLQELTNNDSLKQSVSNFDVVEAKYKSVIYNAYCEAAVSIYGPGVEVPHDTHQGESVKEYVDGLNQAFSKFTDGSKKETMFVSGPGPIMKDFGTDLFDNESDVVRIADVDDSDKQEQVYTHFYDVVKSKTDKVGKWLTDIVTNSAVKHLRSKHSGEDPETQKADNANTAGATTAVTTVYRIDKKDEQKRGSGVGIDKQANDRITDAIKTGRHVVNGKFASMASEVINSYVASASYPGKVFSVNPGNHFVVADDSRKAVYLVHGKNTPSDASASIVFNPAAGDRIHVDNGDGNSLEEHLTKKYSDTSSDYDPARDILHAITNTKETTKDATMASVPFGDFGIQGKEGMYRSPKWNQMMDQNSGPHKSAKTTMLANHAAKISSMSKEQARKTMLDLCFNEYMLRGNTAALSSITSADETESANTVMLMVKKLVSAGYILPSDLLAKCEIPKLTPDIINQINQHTMTDVQKSVLEWRAKTATYLNFITKAGEKLTGAGKADKDAKDSLKSLSAKIKEAAAKIVKPGIVGFKLGNKDCSPELYSKAAALVESKSTIHKVYLINGDTRKYVTARSEQEAIDQYNKNGSKAKVATLVYDPLTDGLPNTIRKDGVKYSDQVKEYNRQIAEAVTDIKVSNPAAVKLAGRTTTVPNSIASIAMEILNITNPKNKVDVEQAKKMVINDVMLLSGRTNRSDILDMLERHARSEAHHDEVNRQLLSSITISGVDKKETAEIAKELVNAAGDVGEIERIASTYNNKLSINASGLQTANSIEINDFDNPVIQSATVPSNGMDKDFSVDTTDYDPEADIKTVLNERGVWYKNRINGLTTAANKYAQSISIVEQIISNERSSKAYRGLIAQSLRDSKNLMGKISLAGHSSFWIEKQGAVVEMASLEMDRTPVRMIGLTTNNITVMCVKAMNKADMLYDQAVELQKSVTASGGRGSAQMLADFSADLTTEPYRAYGTILGGYHYFVGRALQDLRNIIVSQASGMIQSNKDQRKTASDLVNQFISENKETLSSWVGDVAGDSQLADAILNGSVKILEKLDSVIASTYKRLADETVEEESKTKTGVDGDEEEDEETTTPVTDSELTGEEEDTGNDLTDNLNELREMAKGNLDSQAQIPGVTDQEEYKDIMAEYGKLLKPSLPGANADSSARKEYSDYETSVSRLSSRLADYINDNGFVEQAEEELEEQE